MRKLTLIALSGVLCIFFACKKSGNITSQGLSGSWAYLGMSVQTQTTENQAGGVTAVANTSYVTKNNGGTINFAGDSMVISNLTYTVDTSFITYFYYGGVVFDSLSSPLTLSIPPSSATLKYKLIGSDSLYFPSGGILTTLDSSATAGQGSHYALIGDSLTLYSQGVDSSGGALTTVKSTIRMKRQ